MSDDRAEHLVKEKVHLHRVLVLLLRALQQLTVLDLNVKPAVLVQLAEDLLQAGEWLMILLALISKTRTIVSLSVTKSSPIVWTFDAKINQIFCQTLILKI